MHEAIEETQESTPQSQPMRPKSHWLKSPLVLIPVGLLAMICLVCMATLVLFATHKPNIGDAPSPIEESSTTIPDIPISESPSQTLDEPGDATVPVTIKEWLAETQNLSETFTRDGAHYWRYVPGGTYTIGGWTDDGFDNNDEQAEVTLQTYWIAMYPITVRQYRQFINDDGYNNQAYWTAEGWAWKEREGRVQPRHWDQERHVRDSQPAIGVTWYEAMAFANWLTIKLDMPEEYLVSLPTEATWEVACAYDTDGQRHTYPWGEQTLTPDLSDFGKNWRRDHAEPIGRRPDAAAGCGAQDMVGSVWEWTVSDYDGYATGSDSVIDDVRPEEIVPVRGAGWGDMYEEILCGVRLENRPDAGIYSLNNGDGFRVVLIPLQ